MNILDYNNFIQQAMSQMSQQQQAAVAGQTQPRVDNSQTAYPDDQEGNNGNYGQPEWLDFKLTDGTHRTIKRVPENQDQIDLLVRGGAKPLGLDGREMPVQEFQGGILIGNQPLNVFLGGQWQPGQQAALQAAGLNPTAGTTTLTPPTANQPVPGQPTPTATTPPAGGSTINPATGQQLPSGAREMLQALAQIAAGRTGGIDNLSGEITNLGRYLQDQIGNNANQRDSLISQFLSGNSETGGQGFLPTIYNTISRQNTAEGISPEALSALRSESTSGIQRQYEGAAKNIRSNLLRRGAYGGDMPASSGDIVRDFAPLEQARADAYSSANRNVIMANEEAKRKSLLENRQAASNAVSQLIGATGTIGDIYNPNAYANSANAAYGTALGGINAGTGSLNSSIGAAGGLADLEPGSFRNMLLASLANNAGNIYGAVTGRENPGGTGAGGIINVIGDIWGRIRGGNQTTNTNPSGNAFGF